MWLIPGIGLSALVLLAALAAGLLVTRPRASAPDVLWLALAHAISGSTSHREIIDTQDARRGNSGNAQHLDQNGAACPDWSGHRLSGAGRAPPSPAVAARVRPTSSWPRPCAAHHTPAGGRIVRRRCAAHIGFVAEPATATDAQTHGGTSPRQIHGSTGKPTVPATVQEPFVQPNGGV